MFYPAQRCHRQSWPNLTPACPCVCCLRLPPPSHRQATTKPRLRTPRGHPSKLAMSTVLIPLRGTRALVAATCATQRNKFPPLGTLDALAKVRKESSHRILRHIWARTVPSGSAPDTPTAMGQSWSGACCHHATHRVNMILFIRHEQTKQKSQRPEAEVPRR